MISIQCSADLDEKDFWPQRNRIGARSGTRNLGPNSNAVDFKGHKGVGSHQGKTMPDLAVGPPSSQGKSGLNHQ